LELREQTCSRFLFCFCFFDELATFITTHQDYNTLSSKKLDTTHPYCKKQTSNRDNPLLQTNLAKQLKQQKTTGEKISPIQNSSCIKTSAKTVTYIEYNLEIPIYSRGICLD
jgi:hypothetical protein